MNVLLWYIQNVIFFISIGNYQLSIFILLQNVIYWNCQLAYHSTVHIMQTSLGANIRFLNQNTHNKSMHINHKYLFMKLIMYVYYVCMNTIKLVRLYLNYLIP